ncbi:hypothetical protein DFQ26_003812 [Actinomortierella ambigua]|nr:hypothetical protein DFQ26_003812 [Actinomortierella ambigua]
MASQWNAAEGHDSRSFSDDYNLHGASQRSLDHPSVTRDDIAFDGVWGPSEDDDNNDDMIFGDRADLIADIIDGRPSRLLRQPSRLSGGAASRFGHRQQDEAAFAHYYMDNNHGAHEQWHGSIPHQNDLHSENEDHEDEYEGVQQHVARNTKPSNPEPEVVPAVVVPEKTSPKQIPRPALKSSLARPKQGERRIQLPLEDEDPKLTTTPPASATPPSTTPASTSASASASASTSAAQAPAPLPPVIPVPTLALQTPSSSERGVGPSAKLGVTAVNTLTQESPSTTPRAVSPTTSVKQPSILMAGRFSRVTPKPSQGAQDPSSVKKPVATIPAPPSGNQMAQESVRELRELLKRHSLKLTKSLDAALTSFDAEQMERGGMCDLIGLFKKLSNVYDGLIHDMTDKIIANQKGKDSDNDDDADDDDDNGQGSGGRNSEDERIQAAQAEEIRALREQLQITQDRLKEQARVSKDEVRSANEATRVARGEARAATNETQVLQDQLQTAKDKIAQQQQQLQKQQQALKHHSTPPPPPTTTAGEPLMLTTNLLQDHLAAMDQMLQQRLEMEVQRLVEASKTAQSKQQQQQQQQQRESSLHNSTVVNRLETIEQKVDQLQFSVDGAKDELLEGIDSLHMVPMNTQTVSGVNGTVRHDHLRPALQDIDQVLRELAKLRKFIARAEKIVWDVEIAEGRVLVRSELQASGASTAAAAGGSPGVSTTEGSKMAVQEDQEGGDSKADEKQGHGSGSGVQRRRRTEVVVDEPAGSAFLPGRTCTKSLDATLQRLREWSELLDVLNHVGLDKGGSDGAGYVMQ